MWSGENHASEFSISSFGLAVPQLVEGSHPQEQQQQQLEPRGSNHDVNCGMLGVYPSFLQGYRTHRCYLICLCVLGMTQGFVVNGLVSVVTPTIEKRFQLLGIEVGASIGLSTPVFSVIQSMFNVASCIMTTPVSYHGGVGHKPVIIGIGALFVATGSMVFASPHFLAPPYISQGSGTADVCPQKGPSGKCAALARSGAASANSFKYFFMVGHALHGVGSSPFYTLGVAYLDQNTPSSSASIYMGIFYATSVLGPAMGFLLGGYFLSKYTDITADSSKLGMDPSSANWATPASRVVVGGHGAAVRDAPHDTQIATEPTLGKAPKRSLVDHIKRLACNPTFVCLTLAACAETMIASGLTGFATKIFISMFGISSSQASTLLGIVSVPSACGGTLLGGYAITKLNLKSSTIVRYCVVLSFVPWFTLFVFMHSCPSNQSALVNTTTRGEDRTLTISDLRHSCNAYCNCSSIGYDPVCGSDNFTYYSPCVAGCGNAMKFKKTKVGNRFRLEPDVTELYSQCTCVRGPTLFMAPEGESNETGFYYMARRDPCAADCGLIVVYASAIFIALFFTFLLIVPALTALLGALDEDIKSTGIGVNYVAIRLLGTHAWHLQHLHVRRWL
ncbi:hypothetical protein HPB51_005507 [Rhipicephalus microplus]|uniref:Kazal-like domain-containing protein n=1 Tax=Rhipicephalus microplus TaxID=6941 RepID=A0A9J6EYK3_RHIMP|nr:hypothetical protein HPB51_005507 [Rhipicephalus microplus]